MSSFNSKHPRKPNGQFAPKTASGPKARRGSAARPSGTRHGSPPWAAALRTAPAGATGMSMRDMRWEAGRSTPRGRKYAAAVARTQRSKKISKRRLRSFSR